MNDGNTTSELTIEKVVVNPKLDASLFSKPQVASASTGH